MYGGGGKTISLKWVFRYCFLGFDLVSLIVFLQHMTECMTSYTKCNFNRIYTLFTLIEETERERASEA